MTVRRWLRALDRVACACDPVNCICAGLGAKFKLHGTQMTSQGALILATAVYRALSENSAAMPISLDISSNQLDDEAKEALAKLIPFTSMLDVSDNNLGHGTALAMLDTLPRSPMRTLRMERNEFSRESMIALYGTSNKHGEAVDTHGNEQRPVATLAYRAPLPPSLALMLVFFQPTQRVLHLCTFQLGLDCTVALPSY